MSSDVFIIVDMCGQRSTQASSEKKNNCNSHLLTTYCIPGSPKKFLGCLFDAHNDLMRSAFLRRGVICVVTEALGEITQMASSA